MEKSDYYGLLIAYFSIPIFILMLNSSLFRPTSLVIYNLDIIDIGNYLSGFVIIFGSTLFVIGFSLLMIKYYIDFKDIYNGKWKRV